MSKRTPLRSSFPCRGLPEYVFLNISTLRILEILARENPPRPCALTRTRTVPCLFLRNFFPLRSINRNQSSKVLRDLLNVLQLPCNR